jgi:hypothetical protein
MQDFIQCYRLDCHSLLHQPVEQLAAAHRLAAIKAKRKLIQIIVQVLMANGSLMST